MYKLIFIFLVANIPNVSTSQTTTKSAPYQIENISLTPALFEGIGNAVFFNNKWTIFTKIKPMDFSEVLNFVDKCDAKIKQLCAPLQIKFKTSCNTRTNELETIIYNLRQNNMRLKHMVSHRRNKRAIETIGHFFHWAFGTMDKEDSDKIYDHLSNLDTNENETLNLIKKQITVANSNFDRLSKPIKTLAEEVEKIGNSFENFTTDMENFATATTKELAATKLKVEINEMISLVTSKLLEVQSRQTTELSIFNDLYQNKLHPFILDANNISSVLKNSKYERMVLNPAALFQVVRLLTYPQRDSIVLKITVPLPEPTMFSLFKVYPVRTKLDQHWDLVLDVKTEYIAEADDHTLFVTMTRTELMQCSEVPFNSSITIKVCQHQKPIHTSGSSECLVELLQHSATSKTNCNYVASPTTKGVITKMSTKNQWLFNVRESFALNLNCDGELYTPELKGFGILHILHPCETNTKELRIPYEQVWSSKLKIHQPRVNHSDLIELLRERYANLTVRTFSKPPPLSLGSHSDMIASLKEGKKALEDLQDEANQIVNIKHVNSQRLEVDVHRYSLVSISVLVIALVFFKWYLSRSSSENTAKIPSHITTNVTNVVPEISHAVKIDAVEMDAPPNRTAATRKSIRGVTFARV